MTARTGLTDLIEVLRGMADAGTADYTNGTAIYWDSGHLQSALDRHRIDVNREQLVSTQRYTGGTVQYLDYYSVRDNYEKTTGGTTIFWLEDGAGSVVGTASYSVDYLTGRITFSANTAGSTYYLTGRSYDLNAAAADVWRAKASHYAMAYDVRTDNTSLTRSQLKKQCLEMADYYTRLAPAMVVQMGRSDAP